MNRLDDIEYMKVSLHKLGEAKLMINPHINGAIENDFPDEIIHTFDLETKGILDLYYNWHLNDSETDDRFRLFGTVPIFDDIVYSCIFDFFIGTAIYVSYDMEGRLAIHHEIAEMAMNDVKSFVKKYGLADLIWCYLVIVGFENHQAISYYGTMTEKDFIAGKNHRSWVSHSLEKELFIELALGFLEIIEVEEKRCVQLTQKGRNRMNTEYRMLVDSKYIDHRMKMTYISQFDQLSDWEHISNVMFPNDIQFRKEFLDYIDISEGMDILELGCGSGSLTFDAKLAEKVGKNGWLTATDPSAGMLSRAEDKLNQLDHKNVTFEAASAERIPFNDQEFDGVLGAGFFHFTDNDQALKEMIRVARPEGFVGLAGPLEFDLNQPFFREWFEDIFLLSEQKTSQSKLQIYLHRIEDLTQLFREYGLKHISHQTVNLSWVFPDPQTVVQFMIHGVGFFQQELEFMPMKARNELIQRLLEKGEKICARYSLNERTIQLPSYYIKGVV
ncbi:class I SAM-dependent methyltransferase [Tuberibacillus sp. Marseille-P3662]|uniref:class I SAM-dependent methyltransferase n=1 Tax=Tuberibacillus sp. Marseille-P3662 TaxID=1965358 RepID=UPI0015936ACE|nr:methyltransferase domain-containing protein [Tuberibacillus sp. Marseille-P3662]